MQFLNLLRQIINLLLRPFENILSFITARNYPPAPSTPKPKTDPQPPPRPPVPGSKK